MCNGEAPTCGIYSDYTRKQAACLQMYSARRAQSTRNSAETPAISPGLQNVLSTLPRGQERGRVVSREQVDMERLEQRALSHGLTEVIYKIVYGLTSASLSTNAQLLPRRTLSCLHSLHSQSKTCTWTWRFMQVITDRAITKWRKATATLPDGTENKGWTFWSWGREVRHRPRPEPVPRRLPRKC